MITETNINIREMKILSASISISCLTIISPIKVEHVRF